MNSNDLEGNWEQQKEKLKKKFVALTNNKSIFSETKNEEILKKYQEKLGKTREELIVIFQSL